MPETLLTQQSLTGFIAGAILTVAVLAIGHWMPNPFTTRGVPRTVGDLFFRYVYGTASLWLGAAVWLASAGLWSVAAGLMLINIAGGLIVSFAYGWDNIVTHIKRSQIGQAVIDEESE